MPTCANIIKNLLGTVVAVIIVAVTAYVLSNSGISLKAKTYLNVSLASLGLPTSKGTSLLLPEVTNTSTGLQSTETNLDSVVIQVVSAVPSTTALPTTRLRASTTTTTFWRNMSFRGKVPFCSVPMANKMTSEWRTNKYNWNMEPEGSYKNLSRMNGTIMSGAFSDILLIVTKSKGHAIPWIHKSYRPHFWDVLFLQPNYEKRSEAQRLASAGYVIDPCLPSPHLEDCPWKGQPRGKAAEWCQKTCSLDPNGGCTDIMYFCVARILPLLMQDPPVQIPFNRTPQLRTSDRGTLRGVMVIHSDAWLGPFFGPGLDFKKMLHLHSDNAQCQPGLDDGGYRVSEAVINLGYEFGRLPRKLGCQCHAWIDLYYVPRKAWAAWSRAATVIGRRTKLPLMRPWGPLVIWNELALPMAFHMAEEFGDCEGGCKKERMLCWGREGYFLQKIKQAIMLPCGHKINMGDPVNEQGLASQWVKLRRELNVSNLPPVGALGGPKLG